jgi:hypothetical protein
MPTTTASVELHPTGRGFLITTDAGTILAPVDAERALAIAEGLA